MLRPTLSTLLARGFRLRCPRCGQGKLFKGWFSMPERCSECDLKYERDPGYFLGSTYINYAFTAVSLLIIYSVLHFGVGWTNRQLIVPLCSYVVLFPLFFFRYARALWLAADCFFDATGMRDDS